MDAIIRRLRSSAGTRVGNAPRAALFDWKRQLARLGKPVDRSEWLLMPQEINAYYNPQNNEIVFPAAILEPPFFDPNADRGHELRRDWRGDRPRDRPWLR